MAAKNILIGLGNPIMSDDGIGPLVSEQVHKRVSGFDLDTSYGGGFDVVDRILGYRRAVIIDAMVTGSCPPGTVIRIEPQSSVKTLRTSYSHGIDFLEAMEMACSCGAAIPADVILYGIEVENPFSLGQEISKGLRDDLDRIADEIIRDLLNAR